MTTARNRPSLPHKQDSDMFGVSSQQLAYECNKLHKRAHNLEIENALLQKQIDNLDDETDKRFNSLLARFNLHLAEQNNPDK